MAEFEFQEKKVYYESYGSGEPILLLNGIMMSTKSWSPFIKNFSMNNRLILVDFFDQGQSSYMTESYDHGIQIALTRALLDHLELKQANICGISYGAEVGLGFAVKHPERVRRLVLFNGAARTAPLLADIGHAWNEAAKLEGGLAYYLAAIPVIYSDAYYERQLAWMDKRKELLVPYFGNPDVKKRLVRLTNSSENFNVANELFRLDMPMLVVSAEKDYLIPLREQETLTRCVKDVHHVVLPDCGHASMYEKPLLFCALTLGFINAGHTQFAI
ncbi:MAG: alpha/beta hydrolase [Treponema sp.]|jgi:pimeloyl-ACP methyl ester carboxylesterase|nr:alpha/beta hydrolase [Treponema sp.]